jgi:hypothetical protein
MRIRLLGLLIACESPPVLKNIKMGSDYLYLDSIYKDKLKARNNQILMFWRRKDESIDT